MLSGATLFPELPTQPCPFVTSAEIKASEIYSTKALCMRDQLSLTVFCLNDFWVFDDPFEKIKNEPFVSGFPAILNGVLKLNHSEVDNPRMFNLSFYAKDPKIEDAIVLIKSHEDQGGCWYWWKDAILEGWLTPYFKKQFKFHFGNPFPETIYMTIDNVSSAYRLII